MEPFEGSVEPFIVARGSAEASGPGEAFLHYPTARQQHKSAFGHGMFDHFEPDTVALGGLRRVRPGVALIDIRHLDRASGDLVHVLSQRLDLRPVALIAGVQRERLFRGEAPLRLEASPEIYSAELPVRRIPGGTLAFHIIGSARNQPSVRTGQAYIRKSMHVPLNPDAVRDAMPTLFDLLSEETHPAVRVVLGHFFFVYIHPYMDGNGRIGRFLINLMMVAGGYPWTVVPVSDRAAYMNALERASVDGDIVPFADFLAALTKHGLDRDPLPPISLRPPAGVALHALKKFRCRDFKYTRKCFQHSKSCLAATIFKLRDVRTTDSRHLGKIILTPATVLP